MESVPTDVAAPSPDGDFQASAAAIPLAEARAARLKRGPATPETVRAAVMEDTRVRLRLQRQAPLTRRRHVARAFRRFFVLVFADLTAYWVMRELLRAVRDYAMVGATAAQSLREAAPRGMLNGSQYAFALLVGLLVTGNYGRGADRRKDPRRLFLACALATALPMWMRIWTDGAEGVLGQYVLTTLLVWVGLVTERLTLDRIVARVAPPAKHAARALFVGEPERCRQAIESPALSEDAGYRSVGIVDVRVPPSREAMGHVNDFVRLLHVSEAETVVLCGTLAEGQLNEVVDASLTAGCQLLSVPRLIEAFGVQPTVVSRDGHFLVELSRPTLQAGQLLAKRVVDVVVGTVGLLIVAPVFLLIWLLVRLESRGPGLFAQQRLGRNLKPFQCLKFRSMHANAEQRLLSDPALLERYKACGYKLPASEDPRLTRVGRFLRRTSLDELPQLVNVLRGDMSLVGPRPIVPEELQQYGRWSALFLSLKPGMTGAWAVNGRSTVAYPDRADLELEYVRTWSVLGDVRILLRTLPAVLRRTGAH